MPKVMQHNMIQMGEGESHPIFNWAYFPENLASLIETAILTLLWIFGFCVLGVLMVNAFHIYTGNSALLFIFHESMGLLFIKIGLTNTVFGNMVALFGLAVGYYLVRKYFEFVKYNLHVIRNKEENGQ